MIAEAAIEAVAIAIGVFWIAINAYHYYPLVVAPLQRRWLSGNAQDNPSMFDGGYRDPPSIDVLVPAYQESDVIEQAVSSIRDAEYDQSRLNLTVLVEPDDEATISAVDRLSERFELVKEVVPSTFPGDPNKPRALNYGFSRTDGEIVGVVDAEDIVDEETFREVVDAIAHGGNHFVQGRLDMVNEGDGWLNTLFRCEYGYWYELTTSAFSSVRYPIPMAGTTCFFRRDALEEISDIRIETYGHPWSSAVRERVAELGFEEVFPWDPENVTEDFELGLLLWKEGYEFQYLRATTVEESPLTLDGWLKQRTRWQKGKMYTFRQFLRHPPKTYRKRLHIYMQSLVPHIGPLNLVGLFVLLVGANLAGYTPSVYVTALLVVGLLFAIAMVFTYMVGYWKVSDTPRRVRSRRTLIVFLTVPSYWILHWIADIRAAYQVYTGDLDWSKTPHIGRNNSDSERVFSTDGTFTPTELLSDRLRVAGLLAVLLVGTGLRLYQIDQWSLYIDETYTMMFRGQEPVTELLFGEYDTHPFLYYLFLHYWQDVFGMSALSGRTLSAAFSVAGVFVMFLLGTRLFDDRVGLLAALLMATSTFHIHHGRIARMYSLYSLLTLLSWYWFVRLQDRREGWSALGYLVSSVLLIYTHTYALFVIVAQNVYVALSSENNGIDDGRWVSLQLVLGVLITPWLLVLGYRVVQISSTARESVISWIPVPTSNVITETLVKFIGFPSHYPILGGTPFTYNVAAVLMFVYVGGVIMSLVSYGTDGEFSLTDTRKTGQLALLLFVPSVIPLVVSYLVIPVYWARFTIPSSLGLILFVSKGVSNVRRPGIRVSLIAVLVVGSGVTAVAYHQGQTIEDWESTAELLETETDGDDLVVVQPFWIEPRLGYYTGDVAAETYQAPKAGDITESELQRIRSLAADHDRVVLLDYRPARETAIEDTLESRYSSETLYHQGVIKVTAYERESPSSTRPLPARTPGRAGSWPTLRARGGDPV